MDQKTWMDTHILKSMVYLSNSEIYPLDKEYMLLVLKRIVWVVSKSVSFFSVLTNDIGVNEWWEMLFSNFSHLVFQKICAILKEKKPDTNSSGKVSIYNYVRESYNYLYHNYHHHSFASIIGHIPILLPL